MREILFRGKHIHVLSGNKYLEDRWIYGYLASEDYINSPELEGEFLICPRTVCQYTGLTDKNGNKIFENDIIECRRKDQHFQSQIEWDCKCGGFMFQDSKEGSMVGLDALLDNGIYNDFEVIGNIFDNPELVENNA